MYRGSKSITFEANASFRPFHHIRHVPEPAVAKPVPADHPSNRPPMEDALETKGKLEVNFP